MKQILFLKYLDLGGQVLMLFPLLFLLIPGYTHFSFLTYFTVGIWQAMSSGLTAPSGAGSAALSRRFYGLVLRCLLGILATSLILYVPVSGNGYIQSGLPDRLERLTGSILLIECTCLLFLGPVMAVWYAMLTLDELNILRNALHHRAEIHWKL
jgi:hypothetical protein